jgi:peroxiredoxin
MKFFLFATTCTLAAGPLLAQSDKSDSSLLKKQQAELKETLADDDKRIEERQKSYYDAQAKKVKYDTIGLAQFRYDVQNLKTQRRMHEVEFIKKHPDYLVSVEALKDAVGYLPDDIPPYDKLFNGLNKEVRKSKEGVALKKTIDGFMAVRIGAEAPLFQQADTSGKMLNLKDLRGKYVLIDFWASWCGPCREENPNVVKAYEQFKDKNFTVLGVSLDKAEKRDAWLKAIKDDGLAWYHVSDLKFWSNAVAQLYSVRSVPQNFLIDPKGKIVGANLRGEALQQKLQELILH